jgi:hypothetical protein
MSGVLLRTDGPVFSDDQQDDGTNLALLNGGTVAALPGFAERQITIGCNRPHRAGAGSAKWRSSFGLVVRAGPAAATEPVGGV